MKSIYSIGQLSKLTDCKPTTIRWYEDQGLLLPAQRSEGNQRRYNETHLNTLSFIRHARALGFDLDAIKQLQKLSGCCYSDHLEADKIAKEHLFGVREKIRKLQALEEELDRMIKACNYEEEHQCKVLDVLSDHSQCVSDKH